MQQIQGKVDEIEVALRRLSAIPFFPTDPEARATIGGAIEAAGLKGKELERQVDKAVAGQARWEGVPSLLKDLPDDTEFMPSNRELYGEPRKMTPEEKAEHERFCAEFNAKINSAVEKKGIRSTRTDRDVVERLHRGER